jgi:hypothetical protein
MKLNSRLLSKRLEARIVAEHLLNFRLQMGVFRRNRGARNAKKTKIGLCEQVRVNWKTAAALP